MKLLITGVGGFVGAAVAQAATKAEHHVVGVLRVKNNSHTSIHAAQLVEADLSKPIATSSPLGRALSSTEVIIHAAGRIQGSSRKEFTRDNVDATKSILRAALDTNVRRFVHIGSTAVYGDRAPERGVVTEESPLGYRISRLDHYSQTKLLAEREVLSTMRDGAIEVVSIRPGWIIGAGDGNLCEIGDRLSRPVFPLIGRGANHLPLTSIESVTSALLLAATHSAASGRVYNVAQDEKISQRAFFEAIARAKEVNPTLLPIPSSLLNRVALVAEVLGSLSARFKPPISRNLVALLGLDAVFPTTRIRSELGWKPTAPIDDILSDALN